MSEVGPDGETKFKMIGPTGNCYGYSKARSGAYRFGLHPRIEGGVAGRRRDADTSDEAPTAKRRRCPKLSEEDIIAIFSKRLAELEKAEHEAARAKEAAAAAAAAGAAAAAAAVAAATADAAAAAVATAKVVAVTAAASAAKTAALQAAEALAGKEA
ncbi:unnamed protein product, partial [Ectocarpus sp. 12 AP-2014]